jgi:hypothetical protein
VANAGRQRDSLFRPDAATLRREMYTFSPSRQSSTPIEEVLHADKQEHA